MKLLQLTREERIKSILLKLADLGRQRLKLKRELHSLKRNRK